MEGNGCEHQRSEEARYDGITAVQRWREKASLRNLVSALAGHFLPACLLIHPANSQAVWASSPQRDLGASWEGVRTSIFREGEREPQDRGAVWWG